MEQGGAQALPAKKLSNFWKIAGIAFGAFIVLKIIAGMNSPMANQCHATRPGIFNSEDVYNPCDFPVNALICAYYTFRTTSNCWNGTYAPGAHYAYMAGEKQSILVTVVIPDLVYVYACKTSHYPVKEPGNDTRYSCSEKKPNLAF